MFLFPYWEVVSSLRMFDVSDDLFDRRFEMIAISGYLFHLNGINETSL